MKKKFLMRFPYHILLFVLLFYSCKEAKNEQKKHKKELITNENLDTLKILKKAAPKLNKSSKQKISSLQKFLLQPFKVHKFKVAKASANSGVASKKRYYFRPNHKGKYYYYFLFGRSQGYLGKEKKKKVRYRDGLKIVVYKHLENQNYADSTEILIAFQARMNDVDLPELAFVGWKSSEITEQLGNPTFIKKEFWLYSSKNCVLILQFKNDLVTQLKYTKLNFEPKKINDFQKIYEKWD